MFTYLTGGINTSSSLSASSAFSVFQANLFIQNTFFF